MSVGTICIVGVRALFDRHGAAATANMVQRLSLVGTSTLINHLNHIGWDDVFPDDVILVMRRSSRHIAINVRLAPQVMMAEGMVLIQPTSTFAADLRASDVVATAAIGRPVTQLLAHPLLDASMTIEEIMVSGITESRVTVTSWSPSVIDVLTHLHGGRRP